MAVSGGRLGLSLVCTVLSVREESLELWLGGRSWAANVQEIEWGKKVCRPLLNTSVFHQHLLTVRVCCWSLELSRPIVLYAGAGEGGRDGVWVL